MDTKAIVASRECLKKAKSALGAMEAARNFAELEASWSDFLSASNRVYAKLEQGAKTSGKSKAWFGRKKHERRTDPLLRYLHHARNVDEHGLEKITERTPSFLALGVGPGGWRIDGTLGPGGQMTVTALGGQVPGVSKFAEFKPGNVRLISVVDRGEMYDPPANVKGKELSPIAAARLALGKLECAIEEAKKLL